MQPSQTFHRCFGPPRCRQTRAGIGHGSLWLTVNPGDNFEREVRDQTYEGCSCPHRTRELTHYTTQTTHTCHGRFSTDLAMISIYYTVRRKWDLGVSERNYLWNQCLHALAWWLGGWLGGWMCGRRLHFSESFVQSLSLTHTQTHKHNNTSIHWCSSWTTRLMLCHTPTLHNWPYNTWLCPSWPGHIGWPLTLTRT